MIKVKKHDLSEAEGLTPDLRFPEFENDGEWEEKKLGKVYSFLVTNSFSRENLNYENGDVKNIHYGDIHTKFSTLFDVTKEYVPFINPDISIERIRKECYCLEGDIIFADASEDLNDVGKSIEIVNINGEKLLAGLHTLLARQIEIKLVIGFGGHLFKSDSVRLQIQRESQGAKVLGISTGRISNIKISFPKNPEEQQKIASCLSSLDELIAAHSEKMDALQAHKKGLMQNLFPQEGQTVPNYRFSEFEDDGEWEIRSIEKYIDLISGIALKSEELTSVKSGKPILRGINITEGKIRHSEEMDKFFLGDISQIKKYLVEENDIVIAMDGSKVGKNVALISKRDAGSILIQRVARINAVNSDVYYLYQHFVSDAFRNYVDVVNTSSGIPHISAKQIRDFEVGFPPKIQEQHKIASCLSEVDGLIAAQAEKIEQLQQHKKGLMQGLFPKIEN